MKQRIGSINGKAIVYGGNSNTDAPHEIRLVDGEGTQQGGGQHVFTYRVNKALDLTVVDNHDVIVSENIFDERVDKLLEWLTNEEPFIVQIITNEKRSGSQFEWNEEQCTHYYIFTDLYAKRMNTGDYIIQAVQQDTTGFYKDRYQTLSIIVGNSPERNGMHLAFKPLHPSKPL